MLPMPAQGITEILIIINVIVFLAEVATGVTLGGSDSGSVFFHGALYGPAITGHNAFPAIPGIQLNGTHQYWRLFFLYFMGKMLEPAIGKLNFVVVYMTALLAGSFGALLFQPDAPTVGASGACFGVLGALMVVARARRISIWQSGLGPTLLINAVFTLSVSNISIGGHLGGFVGGGIAGYAIVELHERRGKQQLALVACAAIAIVSIIAAIAVAGSTGLTPHGTKL
jgi:membrane associated rhomboid family serine protease